MQNKQVYSRGAHIDNDVMAVYRRMVMVYDILDITPWHFFLQQPQQGLRRYCLFSRKCIRHTQMI
jgi:hypothetical protein